MGAPGAGKGTQAELLADKLNLYYSETSKILEDKFKVLSGLSKDSPKRFIKVGSQKYDLFNEQKMWKEGILCSPPLVSFLMKEKIQKLFEEDKSLVLAGSPRTLIEGKELVPFLKKLYGKNNIKIVLIEISPEQTIYRNTHRRLCELMRHPILYAPETEKLTICPLDGSKLIRREGLDNPETIKVRLKEYKERTLPLINYFEEEGLEIKKINGEQSVAGVHKDILEVIQ